TTAATQSAGAQDRQLSLQSNNVFRTAMAHMPSDYAALAYLQPKTITDKLAAIRAALGVQIAAADEAPLRRINSICGSARFEHGFPPGVVLVGRRAAEVALAVVYPGGSGEGPTSRKSARRPDYHRDR